MSDLGLFVLNPPTADWVDRYGPPKFDLVVVHGLNGNRITTWTHTSNRCFWPRDLLPHKLPNARVMTFGYNADLVFNSSTLGIKDHAKKLLACLRDQREEPEEEERPLIFVCHSLGGIVVKKALLMASIDQQYVSISKYTSGIIFMGTPHRGANLANWGSTISGIASVMIRSASRNLLDALKTNSQPLRDISEDFVTIVARYKITSFYEEDKLGNFVTVVTKDSATMQITQEDAIPIKGHHRDICRFTGLDDENFDAVWKAIRRLIPKEENRPLTEDQARLLDSLSTAISFDPVDGIDEPCPGTTDWILSHPMFVKWLTSKSRNTLNIVGKPGSGKSVLGAFLYNSGIENVLNRQPFYFAFKEHGNDSSASVARRAILYQMLANNPSLFSKLPTRLQQSRRGLSSISWTESQLKQTFDHLILKITKLTVIIIDGLDQLEDDVEGFIDSFVPLSQRRSSTQVKLLFLSRQGRVSSSLSSKLTGVKTLDLDEQSAHQQAIHSAIRLKVNELCKKRRFPQQLANNIMTELLSRSHGMYLLPLMAIQSLSKVHATPKNITEELRRFPKNLLEAYRHCLDKVKSEHQQMVATILLWVVFAVRPLSIEELESAVALDDTIKSPSDLEANTASDLFGAEGTSELLGPILKISKIGETSFVFLVHHSTKEFLLRTEQTPDSTVLTSPPVWILRFFANGFPRTNEELCMGAHLHMASLCWEYFTLFAPQLQEIAEREYILKRLPETDQSLTLEGNDRRLVHREHHPAPRPTENEEKDPYKKFPTLKYCIENLPEHSRLISKRIDSFHVPFATALLSATGSTFINQFWRLQDPGQFYEEQPALHFATTLALGPEIECLLEHGIRADSRDGYGNTALDVAASTGVVETLRILHKIGRARINAPQKIYIPATHETVCSTVLHTAVSYGHKEATEYLIRNGADTKQHDNNMLTPLDIAVRMENHAIAEILLEACGIQTAARLSVELGCTQTLKWLVDEKKFDALLKTEDGSLLDYAIRTDNPSCLEYLTSLQPSILDKPLDGSMHPLHQAAASGANGFISFLIDRLKVDINLVDSRNRSALHYACINEWSQTVRLLLGLGINAQLYDNNGHTALECFLIGDEGHGSNQYVAEAFNDEKTQPKRPPRGSNLLHLALTNGTNRDSAKDSSSTSFTNAKDGKFYVFKTVLKWGINPCEKDAMGRTALCLASKWADERFLHLLDICDCVNEQDKSGMTSLHVILSFPAPTSERVFWGTIKLLDKGADVDIQDGKGRSAVHYAVHHSKQLCELILEKTNALNAQDIQGNSPLHILVAAAETQSWNQQSAENLIMLLDYGANLYIQNVQGIRPIDYFVWNYQGKCDAVLRILENIVFGENEHRTHENLTLIAALRFHKYSTSGKMQLLVGFLRDYLRKDADLVSMSLCESASIPCTSPEDVVELCSLEPHGLLSGLEELDQVSFLQYLSSKGACREEILPFLKFIDPNEYLQLYPKSEERVPGLWRLTVLYSPSADRARWLSNTVIEAVQAGDLDILKSLVDEFNTAVQIRDNEGKTPLAIAAERGDIGMVKYLLSKGADTEAQDNHRLTPMFLAVRRAHLDVMKILEDAGANVSQGMVTHFRISPYTYKLPSDKVSNWLKEHEGCY